MLLAPKAFLVGVWRAITGVKSVVLLYVANLLFAAIVAVPVYHLAGEVLAPSTGTRPFLAAYDAAFVADLFRNHAETFDGAGKAALVGAIFTVLATVFLSGGVLASLADPRRPVNFMTFFSACGRHVFPFLRVLVPAAVVLAILVWLNGLASSGLTALFVDTLERSASAATLWWTLTAKTALFLSLFVLFVVLPVWFARIRCVVDDERGMLAGYLRGIAFSLRNPITLLVFFLLASAVPIVLLGVSDFLLRRIDPGAPLHPLASFGWSFDPAIDPDVAVLVLQQATIFLLLGAFVLRTAGLVTIYRARADAGREPDPELVYADPAPVVDAPKPRRGPPPSTRGAALALLLAAAPFAAARAEEPLPVAPTGPFANEYVIDVRLDRESMTLVGKEEVVFRNLSDATVSEIPFRLYGNAWSSTATQWAKDGRVEDQIRRRGAEHGGYCRIVAVRAGSGEDLADRTRIEETLMHVPVDPPLERNGEARFEIEFETKLPHIVARMGKFGDHVNAMQWFPKLCAHRDGEFVDWPWRNPSEFFADFGRYDVTITVPRDWVVGATGVPAGEPIVTEDVRTERFRAEAVHDFAWCANPHFVKHVARAGTGTEIVLLSQPFLEPKAQLVLEVTRFTIDRYAEWFFPFPYERVTIDAEPHGSGGGMEYPTLFTISSRTPEAIPWLAERSEEPAGVTVHEFNHQYWYGLVATNEFEEAWLDEGITTYMTYKVMDEFFRGRAEAPGLSLAAWDRAVLPTLESGSLLGPIAGYRESPFRSSLGRRFRAGHQLFGYSIPDLRIRGSFNDRFFGRKASYQPFAHDAPLTTFSWEAYRARGQNAYRTIAYSKPALMLRTLEGIAGWERTLELLRTWTRRFAYRHPTSEDFLAVADEVLDDAHHAFLEAAVRGSEVCDWAVEDVRAIPIGPPDGFTPQARPGDPMEPSFSPVEEPPGLLASITARANRWFGAGEAKEDAPVEERGAGDAPAEAKPALHAAEVIVRNRGRLFVPTTVELKYEDGSVETVALDEARPWYRITPAPRPARIVAARVDPTGAIVLDLDVTNNGRLVRPDRGAARAAAATYQYWVQAWLAGVAWFS
ncbi:MAG: M1 family metallopeptidase [Planctomycetota bacterium JB042]